MQYFLGGCAFWGILAFLVYGTRPSAALSTKALAGANRDDKVICLIVMSAVILLCILPMSLGPHWNGDPEYENKFQVKQYEAMTEAILDGRLDLDYGDMDPRLLEMENPYDPGARDEAGVSYHWDHALYKGKYYMYFGIVPVLLLFLPFRVLFGTSLAACHATQIFTFFIIFGFFELFALLARKFFRRLSLSVYLTLASAMSVMSVWYFSYAPAMYCTAISSGVCTQIWSLYFYIKAIWDSGDIRQSVRRGTAGSWLGALAFGCRPTVALVNLFAAPLFLYYFVRKRGLNWKKILLVFLPFVIVGILLMTYNYVRFDNPFEFGQSYQLTIADLTAHMDADFNFISFLNGIIGNFVWYAPMSDSFPFLNFQSLFMNFPICLAAILCLLQKDTLIQLKEKGLTPLVCVLSGCLLAITASQVMASPYQLERYRSDTYWIAGILVYVSFSLFQSALKRKNGRIFGFAVSILAFITIFRCFLMWFRPYDYSFTEYHPEWLGKMAKTLAFGL